MTIAEFRINEFPIPTPNSFPRHITPGPDGAVWFTEFNANKLGRIDENGVIVEYILPNPNSGPGRVVTGGDGNLWFTENNLNRIGGMTPEVPTASACGRRCEEPARRSTVQSGH